MRNKRVSRRLILPVLVMVAGSLMPASFAESGNLKIAAKTTVSTPLGAAELQIKTFGEPIHRAKLAAVDLVRECTREDEMISGEIDFIGTDIIPILPSTAEGMGGPVMLPPRKKYIDMHMAQLAAILPVLQDDINTIKAPDSDTQTATQPMIDQLKSLMQENVLPHYQVLQTLTKNPPYDQNSIVNEAKAIHATIEAMDKLRKQIYDSYRSDPDKGNGPTSSTGTTGGTTVTTTTTTKSGKGCN